MFRQSSLEVPESVFFFMCFFVNNQHRIIVEESVAGSDNLEEVFESNLRRIGRMVAILDTWEEPVPGLPRSSRSFVQESCVGLKL